MRAGVGLAREQDDGPVLIGLAVMVVGLAIKGFSDVLGVLAAGLAVAALLIIPGALIIPFAITLLTGFKIRPVIDKAD